MSEVVGKSIRSIVQIGDCSGVILPKEYLEGQELNRGDTVEIIYGRTVKIKPLSEKEIQRELGEGKEDREMSEFESRR